MTEEKMKAYLVNQTMFNKLTGFLGSLPLTHPASTERDQLLVLLTKHELVDVKIQEDEEDSNEGRTS